MDQRIFEQGLSTEGTSLYLMMTALSDQGASLERERMLSMWNAQEAALDSALEELAARGISEKQANGHWRLQPFERWR
jgi:hypothetical protein